MNVVFCTYCKPIISQVVGYELLSGGQNVNTCFAMNPVSKPWQAQCSQTVSTHQTLGNSGLQGDTQSMRQTPLSATSGSTIPEFFNYIQKLKYELLVYSPKPHGN